MTWSYSGNPVSSPLDEVRFLAGCTDSADQQVSNEEINYLLAEHGSALPAAIALAESLVAKFSSRPDQKTGDIDTKYSQLVKHFTDLAVRLRAKMRVAPYAGGISKADKATVDEDADRDAPAFSVGMMDNT